MPTANETIKKVLDHFESKIGTGGVVSAWNDGNGNWYRKYADGWIEQGGAHVFGGSDARQEQISLNIPFKDTKYFVCSNYCSESSNQYGQCFNLTPSSFTCKGFGKITNLWLACGY